MGWGRVVARYENGDPFIRIKNEHLIDEKKLAAASVKKKSLKRDVYSFTIWLIAIGFWNYTFPNASPIEDVVISTYLYIIDKTNR
jgi:hypothetical protein